MPNAIPAGVDPASLRRRTRAFLDRKESERFFGVVAVRYENGIPVHIRAEESILPNNLPSGEPNNVPVRNPQQ